MIKVFRKILCILMIIFVFSTFVPVKAETNVKEPNPNANTKIELADGTGYLEYRTGEYVLVNDQYENKDTEFRAVWVTPKNGGIQGYYSKQQYKKQILDILDVMEYYNMNVLIFHIRIMNDAFYNSKYNEWSSYYNTNPDWEALPWIIEQCHKRGIEFHAWMNPYRVTEKVYMSKEDVAATFPSSNPACNPDNLLCGTNSYILDPGIPAVQNFLIDTCMEVVRNYDVDAIHFDDYFYDNGVDDSSTRAKYNTSRLSLADFRRKQINDFIENLSKNIRKYNEVYKKSVQLGISPSGVYRSGDGIVYYDEDGNASSNGSLTSTSFQHYGNYHYADTVKWINEEWIDYILPQTYWALEHNLCPYADLMSWWNDIVKYKDVSLYSGIALYQIDTGTGSSWVTNTKEGYNEIMVCNTLENVSGVSIYDYSYLKKSIADNRGFVGVKEIWDRPIILPEIKKAEKIKLDDVTNLKAEPSTEGNLLTWDDNNEAKFYVVYRSENELTFDASEVIDVIGHLSDGKTVSFTDLSADDNKKYNYGVRVQSCTNTLSDGVVVELSDNPTNNTVYLGDFNEFYISDVIIPNADVAVKWDAINYPFGSDIKYFVEYSFDGGEVTTIDDLNYNDTEYSVNIRIPENVSSMTVTLNAFNNIGSSKKEYTFKISAGLGKINGFNYNGKQHTSENVTFDWIGIETESNITYTLQSSTDLLNWTDIESIVSNSKDKLTINYKTPDKEGKVYYRVFASGANGEIGFSDIITLNLKIHLGEIENIKFNEEEAPNIYFSENKKDLVITFNSLESYYGVSYSIYYSVDYKEWQPISKYYKYANIEIGEETVKVVIPINDSEFKIYLKIEAYNIKSNSLSDVYTVYVEVKDVFYAYVLDYYVDDLSSFINRQGIYK